MNRADKLAMFSKEIESIVDDDLRKLATEVIAGADDYFFTIPASSRISLTRGSKRTRSSPSTAPSLIMETFNEASSDTSLKDSFTEQAVIPVIRIAAINNIFLLVFIVCYSVLLLLAGLNFLFT
jgi:hypothetical protein